MAQEITVESLLVHADWVRQVARSLVMDEDRAEDVVQQTWLAALERPPRHGANLRAWLGRVASNVARGLGRQDTRRRWREVERSPIISPVESPEQLVHRASLQRQVVDAVLGLHEPYRTTVLYRFFSELEPTEIARLQAMSVETVRTRLKRGLKMLRERLSAELADPSQRLLALLPLVASGRFPRPVTPGSHAASLAPATSPALFLGALLMSQKIVLGLVVLLVVGASIVTWQWTDNESPAPGEVVEPASGAAAATLGGVAQPIEEVADASADRTPESAPEAPADSTPKPDRGSQETLHGGVLSGRVTDASGRAVADAKVVVGHPDSIPRIPDSLSQFLGQASSLLEDDRSDGQRHFESRSDERGRYEIAGIPPGPMWTVAALHPEHGVALLPGQALDLSEGPRQLDLQLLGGVRFSGRVTDPFGTPLAGVSVAFSGDDEGRYSVGSYRMTDAEGRYETVPLPYRRFYVQVDHQGYFDAGEFVDVPAGDSTRELDFTLEAAPLLEGAILDQSGKRAGLRSRISAAVSPSPPAVGDRRLKLFGSMERPEDQVKFLASYHIEGRVLVDEDRFEYQLEQEGIRFLSLWWDDRWLGTAEVRRGEVEDLRIDVRGIQAGPRPGSIAVWAIDVRTKRPVESYELSLLREDDDAIGRYQRVRLSPSQRTVKDSKGQCLIEELPPAVYRVVVRAPGRAAAWSEGLLGAGEELTIELPLVEAVASVAGRVTSPDGAPVISAVVYLLRPDGELALMLGDAQAKSNADGEFSFTDLPEGDYVVVARSGSKNDDLAPVARSVSAHPDARLELALVTGILVDLDPQGPGGPYQYRLFDDAGFPVVDDVREGTQRFGTPLQVRVSPGHYTAEILSPGYRSSKVPFVAEPGLLIKVPMVEDR